MRLNEIIGHKYMTNLLARYHKTLMEIPLAENLYDPEFDVKIDYNQLFEEENKVLFDHTTYMIEGVPIHLDDNDSLKAVTKPENQNAMKVVFALLTKNFKYYKKLVSEEKVYKKCAYGYVGDMYNRVWAVPNKHINRGTMPMIRFESPSLRVRMENFTEMVFYYSYYINNAYLQYYLKHLQEECQRFYDDVLRSEEESKEDCECEKDPSIELQKNQEEIDTLISLLEFIFSISTKPSILNIMMENRLEPMCEMLLDTIFFIWYKLRVVFRAHPHLITEKWWEPLMADGSPCLEMWLRIQTNLSTHSNSIFHLFKSTIEPLVMGGPPMLEENYMADLYQQYRRNAAKGRSSIPATLKITSGEISPTALQIIREIRTRYSESDLVYQRGNGKLFRSMLRAPMRAFQVTMIYNLLEAIEHDYKAATPVNFEIVFYMYFASMSEEGSKTGQGLPVINYHSKFYNDKILELLAGHGYEVYLYLKENEEIFLGKAISQKMFDFVHNYIDLIPAYDPDHLGVYIRKVIPNHAHIRVFTYVIDTILSGSAKIGSFDSEVHIHMILAITSYFWMVGAKALEPNPGVIRCVVSYIDLLLQNKIELKGITRRGISTGKDKDMVGSYITSTEMTHTILERLYLSTHQMILQYDHTYWVSMFSDWNRYEDILFSFVFSMFDADFYEKSCKKEGAEGDDAGKKSQIISLDPDVTPEYVESMFKVVLEFNSEYARSIEDLMLNISLNCLLNVMEKRVEYHYQINWANILGTMSIFKSELPGSSILLFRKIVIQYFQKNPVIRMLIKKRLEWKERMLSAKEIERIQKIAPKFSLRCQHCKHYWFKPSSSSCAGISANISGSSVSVFYQPLTHYPIQHNAVSWREPKKELVNLPVFYYCSGCHVHYHDICYYGLIPRNKKRITHCAICESKKIERYKLSEDEIEVLIYRRILDGLCF